MTTRQSKSPPPCEQRIDSWTAPVLWMTAGAPPRRTGPLATEPVACYGPGSPAPTRPTELPAMSKTPPRRAYSYVRFSTPQQAQGGSLNRQASLTQAYCARKKLTLDDTLTLQDLGVSAFRGANIRDGA